jgi:hypothetical protein
MQLAASQKAATVKLHYHTDHPEVVVAAAPSTVENAAAMPIQMLPKKKRTRCRFKLMRHWRASPSCPMMWLVRHLPTMMLMACLHLHRPLLYSLNVYGWFVKSITRLRASLALINPSQEQLSQQITTQHQWQVVSLYF